MAGIKIANNAWGTLSATVEAGATAFPFVITTGAAFPVLGSGEWFYVLLQDADGNREIAKVTVFSSGSGVLGGVSRGQEGTTARRWLSGSRISLALTAQSLADYAQDGPATKATASGADAISATFSPSIATLVDGMRLTVRAAAANATAAPTFTPAAGIIAAKVIVKGNGQELAAGDIAGPGHWVDLHYDEALDKWVLLNPSSSVRAIGYGQQWGDYTASRAINTNYTNTTGRPIVVSAGGKSVGATGFYTLYVNSTTADSMNVADSHTFRLTAIVPPGSYYQIGKGGADTLANFSWSELR